MALVCKVTRIRLPYYYYYYYFLLYYRKNAMSVMVSSMSVRYGYDSVVLSIEDIKGLFYQS